MNYFYIFTRLFTHCTLQADKSFKPLAIIISEISQSTKVKKGQYSKNIIFFLQILTKYSTHHSLSADRGFKSLAIIY